MNAKVLSILVAIVVVVGGLAVVFSRSSSAPAEQKSAKVFPELSEKINDVAVARVKSAGGEVVVKKTGTGWGLESRGGYPVEFEKVKEALMSLADLAVLETKTSKPDMYARLGVEDITQAGATSKLVTLEDAAGKTLASLIVGKDAGNAGGKAQVYVRRAGEAASLLAEGRTGPSWSFPTDAMTWVKRELTAFDSGRVKGAIFVQADGSSVVVDRPASTETNYRVADVPAGKELSSPGAANSAAGALAYVSFEDVKPAGELKDGVPSGFAEYHTFDGLRLNIQLSKVGEKTWGVLTASYEAPVLAEGQQPDPIARPAADVRKEAADLTAKWSGWAFLIPDYKAKQFATTMSDLLKKDEPAGEGAPGGEPAQLPQGDSLLSPPK
ncbi:MAG: DUF4340 domain-containing protein [Phycisphaerae bacterium]|nr:DUF4340 domain-containing protein [Phycisphaerae bacterium]